MLGSSVLRQQLDELGGKTGKCQFLLHHCLCRYCDQPGRACRAEAGAGGPAEGEERLKRKVVSLSVLDPAELNRLSNQSAVLLLQVANSLAENAVLLDEFRR